MFHHLLLLTLFLHVQSLPQNSSIVEFLPGFDGPLPFYLETGYIGVGKSEEVQLFYYFVKSESNPKKDPLLLWLTGGPGCSSFTGLAYEVGPLDFAQKAYNGSLPILVSSPYSWTKFASILFLEQPVNTGFSYATTSAYMCTDLQACDQVYEFLRKWFVNHPEFISNPFFVFGDSYSGITVPVIVQLISDGIEAGKEPLINLKGFSLGNPLTFPEEKNYQIPFCYGMGLISDELYESLKETCKGEYQNIDPTNKLCAENVKMFKNLVSGINDQQILEPFCGTDSEESKPHQLLGERRSVEENFIFLKHDGFICQESRVATRKLSTHWANYPKVQEALHVRKGTIRRPWARCRQSIMATSYIITFMNSIPYHVNFSSKGYRSLIYSGDHDMVVPFQSTQAWIKYLNYSIIDDWRPWTIDGQVVGYTRSFANNMTYATIKGGGHTASEYKREESFHMFKRWIAQQPL